MTNFIPLISTGMQEMNVSITKAMLERTNFLHLEIRGFQTGQGNSDRVSNIYGGITAFQSVTLVPNGARRF